MNTELPPAPDKDKCKVVCIGLKTRVMFLMAIEEEVAERLINDKVVMDRPIATYDIRPDQKDAKKFSATNLIYLRIDDIITHVQLFADAEIDWSEVENGSLGF